MKTKWIEKEVTGFDNEEKMAMVQVCTECGHGPGFHLSGKRTIGPHCSGLGYDDSGKPICKCQEIGEVEPTTTERGELIRFKCSECGEGFVDDTDALPLYECGNCGIFFTTETSMSNNHQCPDCGKFGSKISDNGCPECGEGELLEEE